jgi:hypothetical protein
MVSGEARRLSPTGCPSFERFIELGVGHPSWLASLLLVAFGCWLVFLTNI